jgi:hypothetical protein
MSQTLEAKRRSHAGCNRTPQPPLASAHVMRMSNPNVSVYRHGTKDTFLILSQAPLGPGGGASTAFGDFVHVTVEDMQRGGLNLILADLEQYPRRDPNGGSVINGLTPEAKKARKLLREYDEVIVSLHSGSGLTLGPVCVTGRSGDSGTVRKVDVRIVTLPCSSEAFFHELLRAFEKCCYVANV